MQAPPTTLGAPPEAGPADTDPGDTALARMALHRARMRAVIPIDLVVFVAACPACGQDCEWVQERQETRLRSRITCPCSH